MKGIFLFIIISFSLAAEPTSCWKSLPASTLAAIEIDLSDDLLTKLRQHTTLGKTILTEKRLAGFTETFRKHSLINPKLAAVLAELRSSGFTIEEITRILNSKLGIALIPETANSQQYWSVIAWADMKAGLATKIISSLKERNHGDVSKVNGLKVLSYENNWDSSFSLLCASGDKLLMVNAELDDKHKNIDKALKKNVKSRDLCLERFKSFSSSLMSNEEKGFYKSLKNSIFTKKNTLEGRRVIEYHVNLSKLLQSAADNEKKIKLAGLDQLKMLSGRVSLSGNVLQTKTFVETDKKRTSLMKLIDQPLIFTQPESWVPSDVSSYTHMSVDIQLIFDQMREMSSMQFGIAAVNNYLKAVNTRSRAFLGDGLKSIISSFGNKVTLIDYGMELNRKGREVHPQIKSALVIPFNNEVVSNRVIEIMTPFVEEKGILRKDQLGFKGFQFYSEEFTGSFYVGHKNFIFTTGRGISDRVLKSITYPSQNNLANSEKFKEFQKRISQEKTSMISYGNLQYSVGDFYDFAEKILKDENTFAGMEKRDKAFIRELLSNLPTKAEVLTVIGIAGAYAKSTPEGLEINGFMELP